MSTITPVAQFSDFNGINFGSIVSAMMQEDSIPLTNLQTQQSNYQAQSADLAQLGTMVTSMESDVSALNDPTTFSNVDATASNSSVLTASSSGTTSATGNYNVVVSQLARSQVTASSSGFSSATSTVADGGSISFTINGQTSSSIAITSATTLSQLTSSINSQNLGVTASIVNTGSTNLLVISSNQTGTDSGFTINNSLTNSAGSTVAFAAGQSPTTGNMQNAQQAELTANGISITSSSNTIADAIPGVSVTLSQAGSTSIAVTPDYSGVASDLQNIVNDYNSIQTFYSQENTTNSSGSPMALDNDAAMNQVMSGLQSIFSNSSGGSGISSAAQIGIEFTNSGQLQFDQTAFQSAVSSNPTAVQTFLQGTNGSGGILNQLTTTLQDVDPIAGLIYTEQQSLTQTEASNQQRITDEQARLAEEQQTLEQQFTAADDLMTQLNSQTAAISALSGAASSASTSSSSSSNNSTSNLSTSVN